MLHEAWQLPQPLLRTSWNLFLLIKALCLPVCLALSSHAALRDSVAAGDQIAAFRDCSASDVIVV